MWEQFTDGIFWLEEGSGGFNSWRDSYIFKTRTNGRFVVSVRRKTMDSAPNFTASVYRSPPFTRAARFLEETQRARAEAGGEAFTQAEMARIISRVIACHPDAAAKFLRAFAAHLAPNAPCDDLLS